MKRDGDLLREIMLEVVDDPSPTIVMRFFEQPTPDELQREYHFDLLIEAHFLKVKDNSLEPAGKRGTIYKGRRVVRSLSFSVSNLGHDYLDAIRDDTIWKKTKEATTAIGGVTLGMITEIAVAYGKQLLTEKLGISL